MLKLRHCVKKADGEILREFPPRDHAPKMRKYAPFYPF